ncbi:Glycoprotein-polysaccharide metabolism [Salmonella enterica subsp. enterica serovar Give str. S5-487]|nr:Glycoprotein-polysaccharide metabolism [Salmonella enterica subsp. enterica serovar Give str. S5-487]
MHIVSGLAVAISLAACADKSADIQTPAPNPNMSITANQSTIQQPNVSGTVWIRQKVALPPDAVLTVTLSDASLADAPSKVLSQKAVRTEGKQAPFSFVLPFNPSDIQPNARILLSAAITVDNKLVFITDSVKPVINNGGTKADLTLVPVQQTANGGACAGPGTANGGACAGQRWCDDDGSIDFADPGQSVFCRSCAYPVLILRQPSPLRRGLIHPAIAL